MKREEDTEADIQSQITESSFEIMDENVTDAIELHRALEQANKQAQQFMSTRYPSFIIRFDDIKRDNLKKDVKVEKMLSEVNNFLETAKKSYMVNNEETMKKVSTLAETFRNYLENACVRQIKETCDKETSNDPTMLTFSHDWLSQFFGDAASDITLEMYRNFPTDIDLLLIGRTGNGKSATGNSILGESVFIAESSMKSVTKKTAFAYSEVYGKTIKVVDTPGVGDTNCSTEAGRALVKSSIQEAIESNTRGYHAILLVLKYGDRLTKEELKTIQFLKEVFGDEVFKRHGILILTRGDQFDLSQRKPPCSFVDWCRQQEGDFSNLLDEFQNRIILFDNVTKNEKKKCHQITSLILMVEHLCSREYRYTNKQFDEAREKEERLKLEKKRPELSEYSHVECSKIKKDLMYIKTVENLETRIHLLSKLTDTIAKVKQNIKEDDAGTNVFKDIIDDIESLLNVVKEEKTICIALEMERERAADYTAKLNKERNEELVAQKVFHDAKKEDLENKLKKSEETVSALSKELETRKKHFCRVM